MALNIAPAGFNPSQEMSKRSVELRYVLDQTSPEVNLHAHPFYEIYYFLEGAVEGYVIGGHNYTLRAGDILMMPPGVPHHPVFNQESRPYRRYVLWLSADLLGELKALDPTLLNVLTHCQEHESYRIRSSGAAARQTMEVGLRTRWQEEHHPTHCTRAYLFSLCLNFLVLLNRVALDEHLLVPKYQQNDELLDNVLSYIREHYTGPITLNSVADHFFTSPSSIEALMTKRVGKPFYRYVTECRIIRAQTLIASGMPLKEVGLACGYNDYSNFYRAFNREVGISPSQYRHHRPTDHFQSTHIEKIT